MKLSRKSTAKEEKEPRATPKSREKKYEAPKDSTRWLPLLFLFIFLFVSYLFWVAF